MTAVEIAQQLTYCSSEAAQALQDEVDEIAAMIVGLTRSLESKWKQAASRPISMSGRKRAEGDSLGFGSYGSDY